VLASFRAELLKLRKRPAVWVLGSLLVVFVVFLGYLPRYLQYIVGTGDPGFSPLLLLPALLPGEIVRAAPNFVAYGDRPVAIVLGALVAGGEYGWGTFRTALAQRPPRLAVYAGKALALGVVLAAFVLAFYAAAALASSAVAIVEGPRVGGLSEAEIAQRIADPNFPAFEVRGNIRHGLRPPRPVELAKALGASWLILATWASLGLMLATLFRSAAIGMGVGLAWTEVVSGLIQDFGSRLSGALNALAKALPQANAQSLLVSFGEPGGGGAHTPLLSFAQVGAGRALLVLGAYVAAFVAIGALVFRTRDLT
jgi:ABC-type transport system involved in multi-copper enzyme maturation permease subunit